MSMDPDDFEEAARLLLDGQAIGLVDTRHLRVPAGKLDELRQLHAAADAISGTQSGSRAAREASRSLESAMITGLMACLAHGTAEAPRRAWPRRQKIMARFHDWLLANGDQPVYLLDICQAIDVPARTLSLCCHDHLGMSPMRYLWLRRMRLARQALLDRHRPEATVTAIAMEFGFWDLGHFAVSYRHLFGQTPRQTLACRTACEP